MNRTARNPRIRIEHPRRPEPSYVILWATLDGKQEAIVSIPMTEEQLYDLAEQALYAARILKANE